MTEKFKFGTVTVPDGTRGAWTVDTMTLTDDDVMFSNLRAARDGNHYMICPPGTYKRLKHKARGCVMSNTRMEIRTAMDAYIHAHGRVLINGLGLGMVLEGILSKDAVTHVKVVEIEQDVLDLVGPHFTKDPRVVIVQGDAYTYKPAKDEKYDYVWHDIWDDINSDNLALMGKLTRKWAQRAAAQGVWSQKEARREQRRYG
jgi:hypothetical protein